MRRNEVQVLNGRELDYHTTFNYLLENSEPEPTVCKHFGCGKTLRSQEMCCGEYCINHQKRETKDIPSGIEELNMRCPANRI